MTAAASRRERLSEINGGVASHPCRDRLAQARCVSESLCAWTVRAGWSNDANFIGSKQ
jgi:hypothetical protein